jgi:hypothetical protein
MTRLDPKGAAAEAFVTLAGKALTETSAGRALLETPLAKQAMELLSPVGRLMKTREADGIEIISSAPGKGYFSVSNQTAHLFKTATENPFASQIDALAIRTPFVSPIHFPGRITALQGTGEFRALDKTIRDNVLGLEHFAHKAERVVDRTRKYEFTRPVAIDKDPELGIARRFSLRETIAEQGKLVRGEAIDPQTLKPIWQGQAGFVWEHTGIKGITVQNVARNPIEGVGNNPFFHQLEQKGLRIIDGAMPMKAERITKLGQGELGANNVVQELTFTQPSIARASKGELVTKDFGTIPVSVDVVRHVPIHKLRNGTEVQNYFELYNPRGVVRWSKGAEGGMIIDKLGLDSTGKIIGARSNTKDKFQTILDYLDFAL